MRQLQGCAASSVITATRTKQLRAAMGVARVARERSNYSGFYLSGRSCRGKLVLTGVGKPSGKVRASMIAAQRRTGLVATWKRVPHTRVELKREGRRLSRNPLVAFTEVDAAGRVLTIGTEDEALRAASRIGQRQRLNITVRHFRVRGADVPG